MEIRPLNPSDLNWVESTAREYFGSPQVVSRGVVHHPRDLPGLIAQDGPERIGLLQYRIDQDECEIVIIVSIQKRQGIGMSLIKTMEQKAVESGIKRLWLITTNNNTSAQEFYLAAGWTQSAVYPGAVNLSRKLNPEIPLVDDNGRPIRDEIEYERFLVGT